MARLAWALMHPATPALMGNLILLITLVVVMSGQPSDTIAY